MSRMIEVTGIEVDADEVVGGGGFLAVRRMRLRNLRADGSSSAQYCCDFVVRPLGLDAIAVAAYCVGSDGAVQVLLRDGLRPALRFGRTADPPIADRRRYLFLREVCAGIVETEDRGEAGLRQRAALELEEEAGYRVDPGTVEILGASSFPSPGAMAERYWLAAVAIPDRAAQVVPEGDGSPMEEGAQTLWMELEAAIAACVAGEIEDIKTELCLRRLRDHLRR